MSKSIAQLYDEIIGSEELKKELADVLKERDKDKAIEWVKKQGCDATPSEIKEFFIEKNEEIKESGELTPEELEAAAGGVVGISTIVTEITIVMTVEITVDTTGRACDAAKSSCESSSGC